MNEKKECTDRDYCTQRFDAIDRYAEDTNKKVNLMYDRMFVSNGKKSLISQIDEHDGFIEGMKKVLWGIGGTLGAGFMVFVWWGFTVYAKQ